MLLEGLECRVPFWSPGAWSSLESSTLFLLLPVSSLVLTGCMIHGFITFGCFVWFPLQLSRSSWRTGFLHTLQCWNVANTCHRSGVRSNYKNIFHQQEHTSELSPCSSLPYRLHSAPLFSLLVHACRSLSLHPPQAGEWAHLV